MCQKLYYLFVIPQGHRDTMRPVFFCNDLFDKSYFTYYKFFNFLPNEQKTEKFLIALFFYLIYFHFKLLFELNLRFLIIIVLRNFIILKS